MAIATNDTIEKFGTQDEQTTSSASVASTAYSIATDTQEWTNDDDAPMAAATLEWIYASAPTVGTTVDLFLQKIEVEGILDDVFPSDVAPFTYVGSFINAAVTTTQRQTIDIVLPNFKSSSKFVAVIKNNGGQAMTAGWQVFLTPKTYGPAA